MEIRRRLVGLFICIVLMALIIDLVRRRKLREEYSWLWLSLGVAMFVLVLWPDLLDFLTDAIGAVVPTSTLFSLGLLFVVFILIQFSMEISKLSNRVKDLAQHAALLESLLEEVRALPGNQPDSVREELRVLRGDQGEQSDSMREDLQVLHGDQFEDGLVEVKALPLDRRGSG